ncbi:uncharacterized protein BP01DRAFT_159484 [Aspergillus saccharolyticus JOP 1030-1]|uniref:Uncharacterized protein n=1 Tax=Aspergillus saccharolyticus JOP 1030-1 TaxID=1450539 RepID=A0A318ZAU3_9EURO|nr:hypothetical protein BP01DRAFT_159484 [Aspergillus saccharolyticus JOP 1030-1]PYH41833.1 hypothetical protein BP01DRAFT_159484 [Aspergillus saccharolyticus JOP 1030-1]
MSPYSVHGVAFDDLARIFSARHQNNEVLEIEILPPGLGPLLQDGNSVGITKKYLVQAFITARRIFFNALNGTSVIEPGHENTISPCGPWNYASDELLIVSTEIILLFDCEHLTACNWRKRRLAAFIQRHDLADSDVDSLWSLVDALGKELSMTKTFLCSRLHRHTKSPTLWNHRLWALTRLIRIQELEKAASAPRRQLDEFAHGTIPGITNDELTMVLRAGELHPRNYYAFSYMRAVIHIATDTSESGQNASTILAESMMPKALRWCLAHPADISGWAFTNFLLEKVSRGEIRRNAVSQAIQFALDIGWKGESLWVFVCSASTSLDGETMIEDGPWASRWNALAGDSLPKSGLKDGWRVWLERARAAWAADPPVNENNGQPST